MKDNIPDWPAILINGIQKIIYYCQSVVLMYGAALIVYHKHESNNELLLAFLLSAGAIYLFEIGWKLKPRKRLDFTD